MSDAFGYFSTGISDLDGDGTVDGVDLDGVDLDGVELDGVPPTFARAECQKQPKRGLRAHLGEGRFI